MTSPTNIEGIIARLRGLPIPSQELEDMLADFVRDECSSLLETAVERIEGGKFIFEMGLEQRLNNRAKDEVIALLKEMMGKDKV